MRAAREFCHAFLRTFLSHLISKYIFIQYGLLTRKLASLYHFFVVDNHRPFWGFVNELTPDDQDAAIMTPLINSFGSLGGLVGPIVVGLIHEHLGSYRPVLLFFAWTELMATVPLFFCLSAGRSGKASRTYK